MRLCSFYCCLNFACRNTVSNCICGSLLSVSTSDVVCSFYCIALLCITAIAVASVCLSVHLSRATDATSAVLIVKQSVLFGTLGSVVSDTLGLMKFQWVHPQHGCQIWVR